MEGTTIQKAVTEPVVTDPATEPLDDPNNGNTKQKPEGTQELSPEEQLAQLRVENAKLKKSFDKTASEASAYKKQLREKQTADEIALQEKAEKEAERDEQFNKLLKENTVNRYKSDFLTLGYGSEMADKAANAQYENDIDELFKIQKEFLTERQAAIKSDLMKSMPKPPMGNNSGDQDPFLQGFGK